VWPVRTVFRLNIEIYRVNQSLSSMNGSRDSSVGIKTTLLAGSVSGTENRIIYSVKGQNHL